MRSGSKNACQIFSFLFLLIFFRKSQSIHGELHCQDLAAGLYLPLEAEGISLEMYPIVWVGVSGHLLPLHPRAYFREPIPTFSSLGLVSNGLFLFYLF